MKLQTKLEQDGYTIRFTHQRIFDDGVIGTRYEYKDALPEPSGGVTTAVIYDSDGNYRAAASAVCSKKDNFNRTIGRDIALGRAYCLLTGEAERRRTR